MSWQTRRKAKASSLREGAAQSIVCHMAQRLRVLWSPFPPLTPAAPP